MRIEQLDQESKERLFAEYFRVLQYALVQVFRLSEREAANQVRDLKSRFEDAPIQERDLLIHNDPVALACELSETKWSEIDQGLLTRFNETRKSFMKY